MVEPVVTYLNGRGHHIRRARDVGLGRADDSELVEYALANDLTIVTFDADLRKSSIRGGCRCIHFRGRESTARRRLEQCYSELLGLLDAGAKLMTIDSLGTVTETVRQQMPPPLPT